jgi:hypothetical protein
VAAWGESPHTWTLSYAAQDPSQEPAHAVISPHSPGLHFDVTHESLRLDEFLPASRRFPA